jgi:putative spermidine/putrescine transport system permease protein
VRRLPAVAVWVVVGFFLLNLFVMMLAVITSSFATRWFATPLPEGLTTSWYASAWNEFGLGSVITVTLQIALACVALSIVLGVPAAYVLARRRFPGKRLVTLLFLLPLLVPPITYGIPLATVLYKVHLAGHMSGVILANLVPSIPFVILVMTPFIEQIDPKIEAAARMCGAGTLRVFARILTPLLLPGIMAASVMILVRTVGMFELTFFTAGPDSQTLVVALYYSVFAPGIRATESIDALAVMYMLLTLILLIVALRFVNPTQMVGGRVAEEKLV